MPVRLLANRSRSKNYFACAVISQRKKGMVHFARKVA
jgi:hypothetical protein